MNSDAKNSDANQISSPLQPSSLAPNRISASRERTTGRELIAGRLLALGLAVLISNWYWSKLGKRSPSDPYWESYPAPLVMKTGDPHLRALMRTISASESNSPQPYSLLYGGSHIEDLSQHPDRCIPIIAGPNLGDCTTAAGRYQFITTTWQEKAKQYHPKQPQFWFWGNYDFAPEFQDEVVYRWLSDPDAWGGVDLAELLRAGRLEEVLQILSPTWTSLGYGIESNVMTDQLPAIYEQVLQEELQR